MHKLLDLFLFELILFLKRIFGAVVVLSVRFRLRAHHTVSRVHCSGVQGLGNGILTLVLGLLFENR